MRIPLHLTVALLCLLLLACTETAPESDGPTAGEESADTPTEFGDAGVQVDAQALADAHAQLVADAVAQQVADGVPTNPLGRVFEECLVADAEAVGTIGEALGVGDAEGTVLNVVVQDPDVDPNVQCALSYGDATEGAVVLSTKASEATPDETRTSLEAAGFTEVEDASAEGLSDDRVLLFESTSFAASRAVWVGEGFQVSLTANADIADTGALLAALPVAVSETARVLG